jgi:hypothetical protein
MSKAPDQVAKPVVSSPAKGQVKVTFQTVEDLDDVTLRYALFINGKHVGTRIVNSKPWSKPYVTAVFPGFVSGSIANVEVMPFDSRNNYSPKSPVASVRVL